MRELWKSPQAAERLKLSDSTLRKWRVSGEGPRYIKVGGRVLYDPADVQSWMDQRRHDSTSQQAEAALARIDGAAPTPTAQPAGAIGEAGGGVRTVRADHLAALVGAATSYAEDLASGLEDGTYSDRADLEAVNAAIAAVTGEA